jgi:hypothetical protein
MEYNQTLLPNNTNGSVSLPKSYESQMLVDTNKVKERISRNKELVKISDRPDEQGYSRSGAIISDSLYLNDLRKMYKGTPIVVNEVDI